ncbi:MAG: hypothetical protein U0264_05390 [Candidatus Kapaibacterium sp.]
MTIKEHNKLKGLSLGGHVVSLNRPISNEDGEILPAYSLVVLYSISDSGGYHIAGLVTSQKIGVSPKVVDFFNVSYKFLNIGGLIKTLTSTE